MRQLILAFALAGTASAQFSLPGITIEAPRPEDAGWTLRVLSYNIHGIMPWLTVPDPKRDAVEKGRFDEIARRLKILRREGSGPKLVTIQEAWNPWAAKAAKDAGYPYVVEAAPARFGKIGGSGVYVLSEYPVVKSETMNYSDCTGYDCLATKGAVHVRVVVPELARAIDFYSTHMNADEPPAKPEDSLKARMAQIREFAAFVQRTRDPGSVAVLSGDFNVKASGPDFALIKSLLGAVNAAESCLSSKCTGADPAAILRDSVDHHFQLASARSVLSPEHLALTFTELYDGKPLSDHAGLEARFRLSRAARP